VPLVAVLPPVAIIVPHVAVLPLAIVVPPVTAVGFNSVSSDEEEQYWW